jgi:ectoine hydroxylase-related dioxygenase (phytanoyl-CoA dioxygenase family)
MGPLRFAAQSHRCNACRAFEAKSQSQKELDAEIRNCGFRIVEEPFELGELSYHYGWTYHSAGRNSTDRAREVITIIYMDQDIKLAEPTIDWHAKEISKWTPGIKPGEVPASQFNPVLWSS